MTLKSRLVSSRRSLVARVAMIFTAGLSASCQSSTLQSSNIANETCGGQPCAAPISDSATIASGEFILDDSKLDGIRTAVATFEPRVTILVDKNGTPAGCTPPAPGQTADEACLNISYIGGVSVEPTYVSIPGISDPSNVTSSVFNLSTVPVVDGQVDGTAFDDLARLAGSDAYQIEFSLESGVNAITVSADAPANLGPHGVYFNGKAEIVSDAPFGSFLCNCTTNVGDLPQNACDELCTQLQDSSNTAACEGVAIRVKLNRFDVRLGFAPKLPATQKGKWTELFGGKNFHLPEMFDTDVFVVANAAGVGKPFNDIAADTTSDIVVGAELFGCTSFLCTLTDACNSSVASAIASTLSDTLGTQLGGELTARLEPLFNYDSGLPLPCIVGGSPNGCSTSQLTDWAAASFTYQKWSWLAGAFGSYPNGGWLPIKTINRDNLPFSPAKLKFTFDNDIDGDGVLTPDDYCPTINDNDVLFDLDGDGTGDICDRCPFDASNDADGDGICENVDTCPGIPDAPQANCNARSEKAHDATVLGDRCDPVPCAAQVVDPQFEILSKTKCPNPCTFPKCPVGCPIGSYEGTVTLNCGATLNNEIGVYPLASHPVPSIGGTPEAVPDVPTYARFCQISGGVSCTDEDIDIQDEQLDESTCAPPAICADPETMDDRFHRVTFSNGALNGADPNSPTASYTYNVAAKNMLSQALPHTLNWDYNNDYARWKTNNLFQTDPGAPNGLIGNFWLHAQTQAGDVIDIGTGLHGVDGNPLDQDDELANSHNLGLNESGLRPQGDTICVSSTIIKLPFKTGVGQGSGITAYEDEFSSYITWRPLLQPPVNAFHRFDATAYEADYVLPLNEDFFGVPTSAADGEAQIVNDRLGAMAKNRLRDPNVVWVNAAEPFSYQGTQAFPVAVALARIGGEELIDTVRNNGQFLLANQDRGVVLPDARVGSPHAVDYTAVLTRVHRGIFVLGGRDVQTNQETHELWFNPIDSIHWNVVPSDIKVEKVLAATYDFHTDELVVLDETPAGLARLWALKMRTYDSRILGTWPRHQAWNRHWLVVDKEGEVLLASSNVTAKRHAIARLDIQRSGTEEMRIDGIESGNRAFVLPPLVDASGYTLLLRHAPGNGKVKRERYAILPLNSASLADIGDQL